MRLEVDRPAIIANHSRPTAPAHRMLQNESLGTLLSALSITCPAEFMNNDQWRARDLDVLWHPSTQMKDHGELHMIPIRSGRGVWLEDFDGNRYIDAISSWWVKLFGHCNPFINQRLAEQAETLEHVILAGITRAAAAGD